MENVEKSKPIFFTVPTVATAGRKKGERKL